MEDGSRTKSPEHISHWNSTRSPTRGERASRHNACVRVSTVPERVCHVPSGGGRLQRKHGRILQRAAFGSARGADWLRQLRLSVRIKFPWQDVCADVALDDRRGGATGGALRVGAALGAFSGRPPPLFATKGFPRQVLAAGHLSLV